MKFYKFTTFGLALAGLFATTPGSADSTLTGKVQIDGSSTVYPITEAIAEEFQIANPKVRVTVGVSGTGGGFKKFVAGTIDINNASRPIKAKEIKKAKEAKLEYLDLPVAFDGVSVVVNPKNNFVTELTMAQLKKLWMPESTVKTWKDLDSSWPDRPIKLYGPGADSGTFDFFTKKVNGKSRASRSDYMASEDDNVVVTGVSGDIDALGYFGYAYYESNSAKLKAVKLKAKDIAIGPNLESIASGDYPLARPIYIYVSKKSAQRPEIDAFVKFYLENANAIVGEVGYVRLPNAMSKKAYKDYTEGVRNYAIAK